MLLASLLLVPAVLVGTAADAPPPDPATLEALLARLRSPSAAERRAAAEVIAGQPASGLELYGARLLRPRAVTAATLRTLVLETWAQVPNPAYPQKGELWLQKPEPKWVPPKVSKGAPRPKRPPPHDPEQVDWLSALAALDLDGDPALAALPDRVEARALALEAVALARAIGAAGASGRFEAVDPVFDFAFELEGVFRDECGRAIRSMGAYAVPGLVARQHRAGKGLAKHHRWALWQLDRMDRSRPSQAIATAPDDRVRAALLHAYGEARAIDAVEAVLGEVDAPSRQVRREARWAWLRYVSGPPPPPAPMRKRKLPGGKEESEAKEDYLNYREMAELVLRKKMATLREDDREPAGSAEALTRELFAYYDARHAAEWETLLRGAEAKRKAGDLAGAVADYGTILVHDPLPERRGEIAEAFLAYGEKLLAEGQVERGKEVLRQAVAIGPASAEGARAAARVALLEARSARLGGHDDAAALRRALALDPTLDEARRALAEIAARRARRRSHRAITAVATGLGVALGVYVLVLFVGGRAARRRKRPAA